tara:strand:- start:412 stop:1536 length:1125 start_codon:yes stop_codon:yes gene_type:complete
MEQFLKDQIKITLSGTKELTYKIKLYNNPFVLRWLQELKNIIRQKLILEKNYCFIGFADGTRDLTFLCKELNVSIKQINDFNFSQAWQLAGLEPYKIERNFTPTDFMESEDLPIGRQLEGCRLKHEACNELHRYFEDLQGQAWNLSKYYYAADNKTKYAIRQLNNICHEIEGWVNAYRKSKFEPEWIRPSQITTFLHAPRKPLQDSDYELFKQNRYDRELGGVYLHWSQVGKTLYEVWRDHDEAVGEGGINAQELYSGEFDIEWGQTITDANDFKKTETEEFKKWLKDNDYDWEDPKLALGYIKLGQVDLNESFGTDNFLEVYKQMLNCLNIKKIKITGGKQIENVYNYSLSDSNWKDIQINELRKGYESHTLR